MNMSTKKRNLIYPKELVKGNYEFKILWMLKNNEYCLWSDFRASPLNIPESTLSEYLKLLKNRNHLKKESKILSENDKQIKKTLYSSTREGDNRLIELEAFDRNVVYPSEELLISMNKEEKILWMVNNNDFCQWRDLSDERLDISSGSLSKYVNRLKDRDLIKKVPIRGLRYDRYEPTYEGKREYSKILKVYGIDQETRRLETLKRFKEINNEIGYFFEEYNIDDPTISYRFKKYRFLLDYTEYRRIFRTENQYYQTLLYLSINHPSNFENSTSPSDFCERYKIKQDKLVYYLSELEDETLIHFKFFVLSLGKEIKLYFHEKEKIGEMLNSLVEEYLEANVQLISEETSIQKKEVNSSITEDDIYSIIDLITRKHHISDTQLRKY